MPQLRLGGDPVATAYDRNRNGDATIRNAAIALLAVAVVFIALPGLRYGILFALT